MFVDWKENWAGKLFPNPQNSVRAGPALGPAPLAITGGPSNALMLTDGSGNVVRRDQVPQSAQNITSALPKPEQAAKGSGKSGLGSDVQLTVYREKDQIVSTSNPNNRMRALEKPQ